MPNPPTPDELAAAPVYIVTEDQLATMTQRMLDEIGCTYEQLERMARDQSFSSERARLVWFSIKPI